MFDEEEDSNSPWSLFDQFLGFLRNAFAAVGVTATIMFFVGYSWIR